MWTWNLPILKGKIPAEIATFSKFQYFAQNFEELFGTYFWRNFQEFKAPWKWPPAIISWALILGNLAKMLACSQKRDPTAGFCEHAGHFGVDFHAWRRKIANDPNFAPNLTQN